MLKCKIYSEAPLTLFIQIGGIFTDAEFDEFTAFFYNHLRAKQPFYVLFDLRQAKNISSDFIKISKHLISFEQLGRKCVCATAVIVNSTFIEGLINALFKIQKPATPTLVTSNVENACNFLRTGGSEESAGLSEECNEVIG